MTDLPIHISTHHLQLSDALRDFVRKKIAPVNRFASDALAAEIVLRRHGGAKRRFSASARVALPGRDVYGRTVHVDLYVAICRLMRRLARLLRKQDTARSNTRTSNPYLHRQSALTATNRERPCVDGTYTRTPASKKSRHAGNTSFPISPTSRPFALLAR
jgi:ribosomal subunit interface protein